MTQPPDFLQLPTWLISQTAHRSHRLLHDRLTAAGATPYEYRILSALTAAGAGTQADLGRLAMLDRRDVTITVRKLLDRGAVTRQRSPDDARLQVVSLTAAGRQLHAKLTAVMSRVQDDLLDPLPPQARKQLIDLLSRLSA